MRLDKYLKVSRIIKRAKIVNIAEHVRKEEAKEMYIIIEGEEDKE